MPQAIDLIVKNGATTPVSKTFTLISPASGDGGVATWVLKEGAISSVFPMFTASARKTNNRSRKAQYKFRLPSSYTDTVTGLTAVSTAAEINFDVSVPDTFPESLKNDFVAYAVNLFSDDLVKSMTRDAVPAT